MIQLGKFVGGWCGVVADTNYLYIQLAGAGSTVKFIPPAQAQSILILPAQAQCILILWAWANSFQAQADHNTARYISACFICILSISSISVTPVENQH